MVTQIAYTNKNCSDVWEMFVKQNKLHSEMPLHIISDELVDGVDVDNQHIYFNDDKYYQVWINAIEKLNEEYFLYLQEDFILYDNVNLKLIYDYIEFLDENPKYSFVRLIKSGNLGNKQLLPTLYEIESDNPNIFSMQPTIWRSSDFIELMGKVRSVLWYDEDSYRDKMIEMSMIGAYHFNGEKKVGKNHHNSNVYPYTATALVKGKWNMKEYGDILTPLMVKYNINNKIRGVY